MRKNVSTNLDSSILEIVCCEALANIFASFEKIW
jgi:hypothetical protein